MHSSCEEMRGSPRIVYRKPDLKDGLKIYTLIKNSKPLDLNSLYSYLLLSAHFADTCIVADSQGDLVGYISGYIPPGNAKTFFVWQVAVGEGARKKGVALAMLTSLLQRSCLSEVQWIETTVTPSNNASARLFQSLARTFNIPLQTSAFFTQDLFGGQTHEEEVLFRIGPLKNRD